MSNGPHKRRKKFRFTPVVGSTPHVFFPCAKAIIDAEGYNIDDDVLMAALDAVYDAKPDNRRYYQTIDEILRKAQSVASI